ncbi:hypothetical protein MTR67_048107, partial [Solanum verrucosum]
VDNLSETLKFQSKLLRKTSLSDDFWISRTSAYEMERSHSKLPGSDLHFCNLMRKQWCENNIPQMHASVGEPKFVF